MRLKLSITRNPSAAGGSDQQAAIVGAEIEGGERTARGAGVIAGIGMEAAVSFIGACPHA